MKPDSDGTAGVTAPYKWLDAPTAEKRHAPLQWVCASILVVELTERLCYYCFSGSQEFFFEQLGTGAGQSAGLNAAFTTLCYLWPLLGGYLADAFWGRYKTIVRFTLMYVAGTFMCTVAALPGSARSGAAYTLGSMGLLALGTGGIKPNISNFGADQFDVSTRAGRKAQETFYTNFYMVINLGAVGSFGWLTTLCSHGGPFVPQPFGYTAAYGLSTLAMALALLVFVSCQRWYKQKPPGGNAIRGVVMHISSAASRGSWRAAAIHFGAPATVAGLLLTVIAAFRPSSLILVTAVASIMSGLLLTGWGCMGDLEWVNIAKPNASVTRQQTKDFLRVMPMLIGVSLSFNAMYNCMAFWYQEQACQMDLRVAGSFQINGSFFNVADCCAIVLCTPIVLRYLNPLLDRMPGGLTRHRKLIMGCSLACLSVLWAAHLEITRRAQPFLPEVSECAPPGVHMSSMPAWWMMGPYAVMGLAEVYVNPTVYFLSYSQTPLRLRSTAQAVCIMMGAASCGLFTVLTMLWGSSGDFNSVHLENGYFASISLAVPFYVWYSYVQKDFVEKDFDHKPGWVLDDSQEEVDAHGILREVAFQKTGFFKSFMSPTSPAGSPPPSPASSPDSAGWTRPFEEPQPAGAQIDNAASEDTEFVLLTNSG